MRPPGIRPGVRRLLELTLRRPAQLRRDIDEEIGFHIEQRARQLEARGLTPDAARLEAERLFGNVAEARETLGRSAVRRESRLRLRERIGSVAQDVRFAVRALRRSPSFVAVAVACLALGIGANVAIFSVLDGVLLKPLPFADPSSLVRIWSDGAVPPGIYDILRRDQKSYNAIAGYEFGREVSLSGAGEPVRVQLSTTTTNFFETLGVPPLLGRGLRPGDDRVGQENVMVLSHDFWRDRFGGDTAAIGHTVNIDGQPRRIVGVMPPSFRFPSASIAAWTPVRAAPGTPDYWWTTYLQLVGRLRPGVSEASATREVTALLPVARESFPMRMPDEWGRGAAVVSLHESVTGSARPTLLLLIGAVCLVLLIACVNVATLYIGRASGRAREIAVRAALGGGRARILRLLLTESLLVASLGAAVGLALAAGAIRVLVSMLPAGTPRADSITLDARVLAFTAFVTVLSAVLFGLLPAWRATRSDLAASLRASASGTSSSGARRGRAASMLAVLQVAFAVVLVSAAGLLIRTTWNLQHVPLGFRSEGIVTAQIPMPGFANDTSGRTAVFFSTLLERLRAEPGFDRVALVNALPFGDGIQSAAMAVESHPTASGGVPPTPSLSLVSDGYFEALSIPLLGGRLLTPQDREGGQTVAVIDETAARVLWPTESAIGQRIRYVWNQQWMTVVGVVGSVSRDSLNGTPQPSIYLPMRQWPAREMRAVVATSRTLSDARSALRTSLRAIDANVPLGEVRTMADVVTGSAAQSRFTTLLFAVFASVALLLGAVGIYGVISSGVMRRTREIGVRMALGATTAQIARMVLVETLGIAAAGVVLGVGGAYAVSGYIRGMLFGVEAVDPTVLLAVAALLSMVAVIAALAPARRATRVDPLVAIRAD